MKFSTRKSRFETIYAKFGEITEILLNFREIIKILQNIEFGAVRKCVNLVDLEKC